MSYAIISVGGKQYRVQEGQRLLVDRLREDEGATFEPRILMLGGDGEPDFAPDGATVTARVVGHVLGEKVRIGKYKPKSGYRRHTGHRSKLSQIQIESIGSAGERSRRRAERPAAEEPTRTGSAVAQHSGAIPEGYDTMTVAQINEAAPSWDRPALEAALAYEREHGNRKGAVAALESAIAQEESD